MTPHDTLTAVNLVSVFVDWWWLCSSNIQNENKVRKKPKVKMHFSYRHYTLYSF